MRATSLVPVVRWTGVVVLLLMLAAAVYAGVMAIRYWPSIAV